MLRTFNIIFAVTVAVTLSGVLSGCTDPLTMFAGGAKGYCTHNPGSCGQRAPVQTPGAPPR